jgi:hypothetical protein
VSFLGPSRKLIENLGNLSLTSPYEEISFRVLVSLPPTYPASSPPQLQLLSKYIGDFGVDPGLFGAFLRTFITSIDGVEWTPDGVCIFDGLQNVQERCSTWYEDQRRMRGNAEKEVAADAVVTTVQSSKFVSHDALDDWEEQSSVNPPAPRPEGTHITVAEAITDRKSVFVGRACRISHPSQVKSPFPGVAWRL